MFRIHRDVRFSASKDPYKTNSGVVLTRSGNRTIPASSISTCRPRNLSSPPASTCPNPPSLRGCALAPRALPRRSRR
jgi:hypothetical protein